MFDPYMPMKRTVFDTRELDDSVARDDRGAVLVEFALIVPILMMLLFGIIQFGIALDRQQAVTSAARQGARAAIIKNADQDRITARVKATLAPTGMDSTAKITITPSSKIPCNGRSGLDVSVKVVVPHKVDIPFAGRQTATLRAESVFTCE
jgi:Flp pilus assembly protein TadG